MCHVGDWQILYVFSKDEREGKMEDDNADCPTILLMRMLIITVYNGKVFYVA